MAKNKIKKSGKSMLIILTAGLLVMSASACGNAKLSSIKDDTKFTSKVETSKIQETTK